MMNNIKRKVAGLCIGFMAIGGVVAVDTAASVATAPRAEAAQVYHTYMWHPWAASSQKCQRFTNIKYTWWENQIGLNNSRYLSGYVAHSYCGR